MKKNNIYWHCFNKVPGLGPKNFKKIYDYFNCIKNAWYKAKHIDFRKIGISNKLIEQICITRDKINIKYEQELINAEDTNIITIDQDEYPKKLKQIYDPPALIYIKGNIQILNNKYALAIVGSRKISNYGKQASYQIIKDLSRAGMTTVSGLALGCDSLVHEISLENNTSTIAVVGSGSNWDVIYPQSNLRIAKKIINSNGAIISEYPPDERAQIPYFPIRNRIISGLALGTLVIEASKKSGALITAYSSINQNRDVFSIPGSIFNNNSIGTNTLIQKGAKLIMTGQDILDELCLDLVINNNQAYKNFDPVEKLILDSLAAHENLHIDKIINKCKIKPSVVNSTLLNLELKDLIINLGNQTYTIK